MEEESEVTLTQKFGKVAKHVFSVGMLVMMASMALPAVAAVAPAGTATLGDWGLSLVEHYWDMATNPITESATVVDIFNNTINGDFAASSYELGADHAAHGVEHTPLQAVDALSEPFATEHFQSEFNEWMFNQAASGQIMPMDGLVGDNIMQHFSENFYHPPEHEIGH